MEPLVEPAPDGFYVQRGRDWFHVTADWCDQIHHDQFKIHGHQNAALNKLRYHLRNGSPSAAEVAEWLEDVIGEMVKNRQDRKNLGLKAVTRHGHEDLEAVRNGEPVRPWNAAYRKSELHEWIKGQREKG